MLEMIKNMTTKPIKPAATDNDTNKPGKNSVGSAPIAESLHTKEAMIFARNWRRMVANILWYESHVKTAIYNLEGQM